jgi:hypothetical protein
MGGRDINPLIGTLGGISDEVRKGFVEGLNRFIDVHIKGKEGVD